MVRLPALLILLLLSTVAALAQKPIAWGYNAYGQCDPPSGIQAVAIDSGQYHNLVLLPDGNVQAWGNNEHGQTTVPASLQGVVAISAGGYHSMALRSDGTIAAWGYNEYGQCSGPDSNDFIAISAGTQHSLALRANGTVVAWGANESGQSDVPLGLSGVKSVAAGASHSVAVLEDGSVVVWGDGGFDQKLVPPGMGAVKAIEAGAIHTLALLEDGTIAAWGSNDYEQCDVPSGLVNVSAVAAGAYHSMALLQDGSVLAWGRSAQGQIAVPEGTFSAIAGGGFHSAGLQPAGPEMTLMLTEVVGGSTDKLIGTLTLSPTPTEPLTIRLESSSASITVPKTITVPAGSSSATFRARHARVTSDLSYSISAIGGLYACEAEGKLLPFQAKTYFTAISAEGGQSVNVSVKLNARPLADVSVEVSFSDAGVLGLGGPITLTVPSLNMLATRTLSTQEVFVKTRASATGTLDGSSSSAEIVLYPKPKVKAVSVIKWIVGTQRRTVSVEINLPARASGARVLIASSNPNLLVPESLLIPAGETMGTFEVEAADIPALEIAQLTLSSGASVLGQQMSLHPVSVSGIQLSPATVRGGEQTLCTVILNAAVTVDTVVQLSSARQATAPVPASITVPAGSKSVTFTIVTNPVEFAKALAIKAWKNGEVRQCTLRVNP